MAKSNAGRSRGSATSARSRGSSKGGKSMGRGAKTRDAQREAPRTGRKTARQPGSGTARGASAGEGSRANSGSKRGGASTEGGKRSASRTNTSRAKSGGQTSTRNRRQSAVRGAAEPTTDHDFIRRWADERGAKPACVIGTGGKADTGMIRLDFPGYSGKESLQHISWDQWFQAFEDSNLALIYQDETASGKQSNFNKLVDRADAEKASRGKRRAGASTRGRQTSSQGAMPRSRGGRAR